MSDHPGLLRDVRTRLAHALAADVVLEAPQVDWDRRLVVRATYAGERKAFIKIDRCISRHRREVAGIGAAAKAGAPVPEVIWSDPSDPAILALAAIPSDCSLATGGDAWRAAGAAARTLHEGGVPDAVSLYSGGSGTWNEMFLSLLEQELKAAVTMNLVTEVAAGKLFTHAAETLSRLGEPRPVLIHGDLQARHVLVSGDRVHLVDFGDTGWGDAVFDLVVLTHWYPQRLPEVLEGYRAGPDIRARLDELFKPYSLWRHLFVARWYTENGFDPARSRAEAARVGRELLELLGARAG
jgi:aminoglycoside phosphotransferase (APT) family kinase protein